MLNRDTKLFGKQHMLDGSDETCWNSHQVYFIIQPTPSLAALAPCLPGCAARPHHRMIAFAAAHPQGSPQWVVVVFPEAVDVSEVRIMFQGGFVGQVCLLHGVCCVRAVVRVRVRCE